MYSLCGTIALAFAGTQDNLIILLSSDLKPNRINIQEYTINSISGGGQNRVKPPSKLYWKRKKFYRINENGTLNMRRLKAFWSDRKYKTYFTKKEE